MTKGLPAVWRDALRDSNLDKAAKIVGFVLSTYLNAQGRAFPSLETLADGASISPRTVYPAIERLERRGFLSVTRSRSRRGNRYQVTLPVTAQPLRSSEWETAQLSARNTAMARSNGEMVSHESALKRVKAAAAADGLEAAASANGKKGGDEDMDSPFRLGMLAKALGQPYWDLVVIRPPDEPGFVGVFNSLEAAEAERDRLEELGDVDGDHLEVREGEPRSQFVAPRSAS